MLGSQFLHPLYSSAKSRFMTCPATEVTAIETYQHKRTYPRQNIPLLIPIVLSRPIHEIWKTGPIFSIIPILPLTWIFSNDRDSNPQKERKNSYRKEKTPRQRQRKERPLNNKNKKVEHPTRPYPGRS